MAYYQPASILRLIGRSDGFCQPGQWSFPQTDYVAISRYHTTVSGEGDSLTINWAALPKHCFVGGCDWNYPVEFVADTTGLCDGGVWTQLVGRPDVRDQ